LFQTLFKRIVGDGLDRMKLFGKKFRKNLGKSLRKNPGEKPKKILYKNSTSGFAPLFQKWLEN
jgi:hypothetical protein